MRMRRSPSIAAGPSRTRENRMGNAPRGCASRSGRRALAAAASLYSSWPVLTRMKAQASATKEPNGGHEGPQASSVWWQRPRETEFVTISIRQVEVALAPFGISGCHGWREPCGTRTLIEFVDIGHIED